MDMFAIVNHNTAERYSNIMLSPYHPALKTSKMASVRAASLFRVLPSFYSAPALFWFGCAYSPIFANLSIQHRY